MEQAALANEFVLLLPCEGGRGPIDHLALRRLVATLRSLRAVPRREDSPTNLNAAQRLLYD